MNILRERVNRVQLSGALVLAGFVLNAGLVVLLLAWISGSVPVALALPPEKLTILFGDRLV